MNVGFTDENVQALAGWLLALRDPLLRASFRSRHPEFMSAVAQLVEERNEDRAHLGLPMLPDITCMQVGLWDNWPAYSATKRKEPYITHRWGVDIQAWTVPPEKVVLKKGKWQKAYSGDLMSMDVAVDWADRQIHGKNPISGDYRAAVQALADQRPTSLFAPLTYRKEPWGTIFPEEQFVILDLDEATAKVSDAVLSFGLSNDVLWLPPFCLKDINENAYAARPLKKKNLKDTKHQKDRFRYEGKIVAQSRWAVGNKRFNTFRTNENELERVIKGKTLKTSHILSNN